MTLKGFQRICFAIGIAMFTAGLVEEGSQILLSLVSGAFIGFGSMGWETNRA